MKKLNRYTFTLALIAMFGISSCSKLLETDIAGTELAQEDAIKSKNDVLRVLQSCYDVNANLYNGQIQNLGELLSDNLELQAVSGDFGQVYNHNTSIFNGTVSGTYGEPYITVFRANQILDFIEDFDFTAQEKAEIVSQVKFLRAISHWEILKLWAQPFGFSSNNEHPGITYKTNVQVEVLPRNSVAEVYTFVEKDLLEAINSDALPQSSNYYASVDAAKSFLAKLYFQKGDYTKAAQFAGEIINAGTYTLGTNVDRFQADTSASPEVIFKSRSYTLGANNDLRNGGFTANYGINNAPNPFFRATQEFYDAYAGDTNDIRVKRFFEIVDANTPEQFVAVRKFNKQVFDVPIVHLTDMKLLRAEALALSAGDLATAIKDVNDVKERAYGSSLRNLDAGASASAIITAARFERRIEMFGEGDRIQQLKRRGAIEGEPIEIRTDPWNCPGMIIQFPSTERTSLFEINPQGGC